MQARLEPVCEPPGTTIASATPAMVACTPESKVASHAARRAAGRQAAGERAMWRSADQREQGDRGPSGHASTPVGIEDRDDHDRADVVDDGEREQEQLQGRRHSRTGRARTPTAKAMSVAIGMPHPRLPGMPGVDGQRRRNAGTTMPPRAAATGSRRPAGRAARR